MKVLNNLFGKLKKSYKNRFAAFHWPLSSLAQRVAATRPDRILSDRASGKRFPIRALRYWWTRCALLQETQRRNEETIVADVGCSRGHIKRFSGDIPHAKWVGLDMNIDQSALSDCGYSQLHQCDFDEPFPLPDNSVDIIVFLHVIEHLPRPEFTIAELSRILRPGGLLLAGSPVAPCFVAKLREWQLRSRLKTGRVKPGGHINSMDLRRWKKLLQEANLGIGIMTGTFFTRWSGNPLENQAWWVRLNQLWGALLPSLGGEVYLSARKSLLPLPQTAPVPAYARLFPAWRPAWAYTCATVFLCLGLWGTMQPPLLTTCPVKELAVKHQDGNDRFYVLAHPAIDRVQPHPTVGQIEHHDEILFEHAEEAAKGIDAHFLVSRDSLPSIMASMRHLGLNTVHETTIGGHRFVLLSSENYGKQSSIPDGYRYG